MTGRIGHNSKVLRQDAIAKFKAKTREDRIGENTPSDLRWQWEVWLSDLSPNGKLVAFAIRIYADNNGGKSRPSIDTLVMLTGLSKRTVIDQLKAIERLLLIAIDKGSGRATNSYVLVIPDKTLSELSAACSGATIIPLEPRSGASGKPQRDSVVVQEAHHKSRSGANSDRSGAPAAPDITNITTKLESNARELDLKKLAEKLFDAGGDALNDTTPGLHIMTLPEKWIIAGCDLEKDILPIVSVLSKGKRRNSISSWRYFEQAVFDARATREKPMPEGQAKPQRFKSWQDEQLESKRRFREIMEQRSG